MKKAIKFTKTLLLIVLIITYGCSKEDEQISIMLQNLEVTIDENPSVGQVIGTVESDNNASLTFNITSQTPNGALEINESTGELTVADATLFDFETNPTITATVTTDKAQNTATVTITVNNTNELSVQDFTTTVDENPTNGDVLGTVQASGDATLSFSIASQTPVAALSVDASTGELTVADATLFDYETNPTITATISVDNSGNTQTLMATIMLNNVNELSVQDFTSTVDENPTNGNVLGTVQASGDNTLAYSITSQSPSGAVSIDTATGELTVADATLFDYETNPTITATISVDNSGNTQTLTATINLEDKHEIGEYKFGGVIFWINATGDEGLVCTIFDQSSGITWYTGTNGNSGATGVEIGTGQANTTAIVSYVGSGNYAAQLCNDLTLNGYSDWFLPSIGELEEMYTHKTIIGSVSLAYEGTALLGAPNDYWSSTQATTSQAKAIRFSDPAQSFNVSKGNSYRVRAVRAWTDF